MPQGNRVFKHTAWPMAKTLIFVHYSVVILNKWETLKLEHDTSTPLWSNQTKEKKRNKREKLQHNVNNCSYERKNKYHMLSWRVPHSLDLVEIDKECNK